MQRLLAALVFALAVPVAAHEAQPDSYRELQELDRRLFEAGWQLATANAAYCEDATPALGVMWQDALTYPDPEAAMAGAPGPIFAQVVVEGSPAGESGLATGDTLTAINGLTIAEQYQPSDPTWRRMQDIRTAIELLLERNARIYLSWHRRADDHLASTTIEGTPACPSHFEVTGIGNRAVADGRRVLFGSEFVGFDYPEDEFAAAVAHELAHNLLGHRAWLDANGRKRTNIRLTEREADRLSPWLLANAGYDPAAAERFMRQWGPAHGGGLLRKRTHDGWDERAEFIAAELPLITAARDADGKADWSRHFRREIAD